MTGTVCLSTYVGGQLRYRLPNLPSELSFFQSLSFFPFNKMPHCKKGRLAGGARKEINETRAAEAVAIAFMSDAERVRKSKVLDFVFGRVTKMTGANHVRVAIAAKRGTREIAARIPNIFARRGATPIGTTNIVSVYTGPDFDPDGRSECTAAEHYDITSILTARQVADLRKAGIIPDWMTTTDVEDSKAGKVDDVGFEWYRGGDEEKEDAKDGDAAAAAAAGAGFSRKDSRRAAVGGGDDDDDIDIDDI